MAKLPFKVQTGIQFADGSSQTTAVQPISNTSSISANTITSNNATFSGNVSVSGWNSVPQLWFKGSLTGDATLTSLSDTLIPWNSNDDPKGWWNSGNNRLIPGKVGWYKISYKVNFLVSGSSSTNQMNTQIRVNGQSISIAATDNNQYNPRTVINEAFTYLGSVTDYLEFTAYTTTSGQNIQGAQFGSSVFVQWISN